MTQLADFGPDSQPLAGQVALVTGGGRGLGRAMAQTLAQAGMAVCVVARTMSEVAETVALIETVQGKALALSLSVTDEQAVRQMAEEVEQQVSAGFLMARLMSSATRRSMSVETELPMT